MIPASISRWRILLASLTLFASFFTTLNTASAATCTTNCLSVYSIELTNLGNSIRGIVKLIDDQGRAGGARSAVVHAVWTRPDG